MTEYDKMVFAASKPEPYFDGFTLLYPYTLDVWITYFFSMILAASVLKLVSSMEGQLLNIPKDFLCIGSGSYWFVLAATLSQEKNISRLHDSKSATRVAIYTWIFVALVAATGYSGTLMAFLTKPSFSKPIASFKDVLASGLKFDMVLYGEELETSLAQSTEQVPSAIWEGKQVVEFEQVIFDRVRHAHICYEYFSFHMPEMLFSSFQKL